MLLSPVLNHLLILQSSSTFTCSSFNPQAHRHYHQDNFSSFNFYLCCNGICWWWIYGVDDSVYVWCLNFVIFFHIQSSSISSSYLGSTYSMKCLSKVDDGDDPRRKFCKTHYWFWCNWWKIGPKDGLRCSCLVLYVWLFKLGMELCSEALEETVTSEEAQSLFEKAALKFHEVVALAFFNCSEKMNSLGQIH